MKALTLEQIESINQILLNMSYDLKKTKSENILSEYNLLKGPGSLLPRIFKMYDKQDEMESFRDILTSFSGTLLQIGLSATRFGKIPVFMCWSLMALYDSQMYAVTKQPLYLLNLVIDLLCMATEGAMKWMFNSASKIISILARILGNTSKKSLTVILTTLWKVPSLRENLKLLVVGGGISLEVFKKTLNLFGKNLKMTKIYTWYENFKTLYNEIIEILKAKIFGVVSTKAANVLTGFAVKAINIGAKFDKELFVMLEKLSSKEINNYFKIYIDDAQLKAAKSLAETWGRDKPTSVILGKIDEKYGTQYKDFFGWALYTYKSDKGIKSPNLLKDVLTWKIPVENTSGQRELAFDYAKSFN